MSNFEMKKKAAELIKRYLGMTVTTKQIELLEASEDGKYLYFKVTNSPVAYSYTRRIFNSFCMYPTTAGHNGMELEWIEE